MSESMEGEILVYLRISPAGGTGVKTGDVSPCWASSFARGGKGTKTPPGRPRAIPLRYPRRPGPPLRESRRPCVDRSQQNMRALTPPFASQNGEDFTGDKQYSPPRWRQKLTAAASYPPGPPGPPDGTSDQQRLSAERQVFSPRGRHPAIVNSEARFHPVGAGTNFTVAERQRAGMREVSCPLPAPNSIKISD